MKMKNSTLGTPFKVLAMSLIHCHIILFLYMDSSCTPPLPDDIIKGGSIILINLIFSKVGEATITKFDLELE